METSMSTLDINQSLCASLKDYVDSLGGLEHIYPTAHLMDICNQDAYTSTSIAPSSLEITSKDEIDPPPRCHFYREAMTGDRWNHIVRDIQEQLKMRLKLNLSENEQIHNHVMSAAADFGKDIVSNIRNVAELRYSDPLVSALCGAWNCTVVLKDTERSDYTPPPHQVEAGPSGISVAVTSKEERLHSKVVTEQSKDDYTYAVCIFRDRTSEEIVSVLILTKHTTNSWLKRVMAQAVGYFAAFSNTVQTPIFYVLTEHCIQLVLFPFEKKGVRLINAVALPPLPLFESGLPCLQTLSVVVSIFKCTTSILIQIPPECSSLSRQGLRKYVSESTDEQQSQDAKERITKEMREQERELLADQEESPPKKKRLVQSKEDTD